MLADVVCLRRHGKRLPAELVKAADPVRGSLRLDLRRVPWVDRRQELRAFLLAPDAPRALLPCLDHCRVTKISERGLLIVGVEEVKLLSRQWADFRQAWWVRPVLG